MAGWIGCPLIDALAVDTGCAPILYYSQSLRRLDNLGSSFLHSQLPGGGQFGRLSPVHQPFLVLLGLGPLLVTHFLNSFALSKRQNP